MQLLLILSRPAVPAVLPLWHPSPLPLPAPLPPPMLAGMLTMDGRCKSLDASADGYVRAENCIAFLLEAVDISAAATGGGAGEAGQPPLLSSTMVVIRGSAVNQDGRSSSLTAPNGPAQQGAIRASLLAGEVEAGAVGTLEMHGTGTPLGDPIEVGAAVAVLQVRGNSASGAICLA